MTWAPRSSLRLYVKGILGAETAAPSYEAAGLGALLYVTWGSSNLLGERCWPGRIRPGGFKGSIRGMTVHPRELSAEQIASLAGKLVRRSGRAAGRTGVSHE